MSLIEILALFFYIWSNANYCPSSDLKTDLYICPKELNLHNLKFDFNDKMIEIVKSFVAMKSNKLIRALINLH